ncbi:DciA family protein [Methylobacillus glycogenes]|uniref:DciA family protein n=1 Tax=Methylobacillus glycogenes TaxID=406 RepID=UPI001F1A4A6D|nr:DciA family protein [Methylobacillus glycogenes]
MECYRTRCAQTLYQAGSITHKRLTVYADNGAVAAKIKIMLPSLILWLQKQGLEVTSIRVEVQVKSTHNKPAKPPRTLSPAAAASLEKLAAELHGSALGDAIARLSSRR